MASTMLESIIFKDSFGTPEMRNVFSDESLIKAYVEVEVALAKAQGKTGVIPLSSANNIEKNAHKASFDWQELKREAENVGYPILGLVRQLSKACGEHGKYIHWGATTQDIMDTAAVLQIREALELIEKDLANVCQHLRGLASKYKATPMAGRTHLQQALPITFGMKCAIWLSSLERHQTRLNELKPRVLMAQLGGAAGTLASMGEKALEVRDEFAKALNLNPPLITWHVARDGLVETVNLLALITGSLAKIGFDVMLMMMSELGEVFEPFASHRGASSTMPQKRNPISSEILVANAKAVRQQAGLMLDALVQDFERATGPWHIEWLAMNESFILTAGSLNQANFMLAGLIVDEKAMLRNLNLTRGLIVAEAVMMGLAPTLGRTPAHDVVYAACREAIAQNISLYDVLSKNTDITSKISLDKLQALCNPVNYLGSSITMTEKYLKETK